MQNNDNQTNQNDPQNGGQNEAENISPGVCSIWLGLVGVFQEELVNTLPKSSPNGLNELRI